jgi:hypothetical protein
VEIIKLLLEEVITTGTGAAFTPGDGPQYATPFAFGKGKKKKRMPIIRKRIFEEMEYTPELGQEELNKFSQQVSEATSRVDRFLKAFEGMSVGSMIKNPSSVEQLVSLGDRLWENLEKIHDDVDEFAWKAEEKGDRETYKKYSDLTNVCRGLQSSLKGVGEALEAITKAAEKVSLSESELEEDRCSDKGKGKTWGKGGLKENATPEIPKELSGIGSKEEYEKYLSTIFPDSQVKEVVYHGTMKGSKMKEEGAKGFVTYFSTDHEYANTFGFPVNREVYMAKINVKNPYKAHAPLADVPKEVHDSDEYVNPRIVKNTNSSFDSVIGVDAGQDKGNTIAVFSPEQIHILGSPKDIEGFKKYIKTA